MELKLVPTGIKNQHKKLGMEALNIVEDRIQDMCTCARNLGCNSTQDCYVYLCNGLWWTVLINLFCYILCKFVWILCVAQVEGAAQWLPRANTSFMLVLCSRQIPAKANKLILSYLILSVPKAQPATRHRNSSVTVCWRSSRPRPRFAFKYIFIEEKSNKCTANRKAHFH